MSDLMQTFPVKRIIEHGPGVKSFYFDRMTDAVAGQFVNVWLPGIDEKPYSVSALGEDWLEISVKAYGVFSGAMMKLKVGDLVGIRGPFGKGFTFRDNALIIGGGIGIAPLRILARELSERNFRFVSLLGAATAHEVIFVDDFRRRSSNCYVTTDDGTLGKKGLVTDDLLEIIKKEKIEFVYAAGPEIMFVKIKELIDPLGIAYEFCLERYMKCGIGICGQCTLDGSGIRLCVEGPVLNQDDLKAVTELGLPHRDASGRRV
ncbi:MAG: dihydroorotate dehydrogenase electron transfer subunit [Calditrichaeota bacterium]|nr:dihydroorotate dehydrogenase electron transfer subunit [Calditrichota bacterium]